jgi:hypothetical protein
MHSESMGINDLAVLEILRDLTKNMACLARDVQAILNETYNQAQSPPTGQVRRLPESLIAEHADPGSIHVLHQRLDAICREMRNEQG